MFPAGLPPCKTSFPVLSQRLAPVRTLAGKHPVPAQPSAVLVKRKVVDFGQQAVSLGYDKATSAALFKASIGNHFVKIEHRFILLAP